jgi:hypothetical protein
MSLRGFHIVFIVLAALTDLFVWQWTRTNVDDVELMNLGWLRVCSGWLAVVIIAYGAWFILKKARTIIVQ